jgi:hypothetical protein
MKLATRLLLLACVAMLAACTPVAAWERGNLARPEMALESDPLEGTLDDHVYFSKEASSGGNSTSGGGCGCN